MNKGKYVFSQLLDFLDRNDFNYLAKKYDGDKYVKQFSCYNQLATLMFGQLSNRESLRDVVLATQALAPKAYALGFGKFVTRSNLSKANNNRDYRIFEEFAYQVVAEARKCRATDIFKLGGNVYAFDSTTIELCLETFKWAIFRKHQRKGGIKVHTLYDLETSIPTFFHITEARVNDMNAMDAIPYEEDSFYNLRPWLQRLRKTVPDQCHRRLFRRTGQEEQRLQTHEMDEAIPERIGYTVRRHRVHE